MKFGEISLRSLYVGCCVLWGTICLGHDFEGELKADAMPLGLKPEIMRYAHQGSQWVNLAGMNPDDPSSRVSVSIEKRSMPTHPHRVAATKGFVNGFATTMAKAGFRVTDMPPIDLEHTDFTKRQIYKLRFENQVGAIKLVALQIWFDDHRGVMGTVLVDEDDQREKLLRWMQSVQLPNQEEEIRAWTSNSGHRLRARFLSYDNRIVSLRREDGKQVRVELDQLSASDQDYLGQRALTPMEVLDKDKILVLPLPLGFAAAPTKSKGAAAFRHLDGTTVEVALTTWQDDFAADARSFIAKASGSSDVTSLRGTPFFVSNVEAGDRSFRFYGAKQDGLAAMMIVDAESQAKLRRHTASFDQAARMLQRVK